MYALKTAKALTVRMVAIARSLAVLFPDVAGVILTDGFGGV